MTRTQILFPDELYSRAKKFADAEEISLAEIVRRGVEMFLRVTAPAVEVPSKKWQPPVIRDMETLIDPFEKDDWRYDMLMSRNDDCGAKPQVAESPRAEYAKKNNPRRRSKK